MTHLASRLAALTLLVSLTGPALAASSAASSASDSVTTSVGSISGSFERSSASSSNAATAADGDYKVIDMAAVADKPGMVRMKLQALAENTAGDREFVLVLPQEAVQRGAITVGGVVTAHHRDYGYEFANREAQLPFFLVLADDWYKELQSRPVKL